MVGRGGLAARWRCAADGRGWSGRPAKGGSRDAGVWNWEWKEIYDAP